MFIEIDIHRYLQNRSVAIFGKRSSLYYGTLGRATARARWRWRWLRHAPHAALFGSFTTTCCSTSRIRSVSTSRVSLMVRAKGAGAGFSRLSSRRKFSASMAVFKFYDTSLGPQRPSCYRTSGTRWWRRDSAHRRHEGLRHPPRLQLGRAQAARTTPKVRTARSWKTARARA